MDLRQHIESAWEGAKSAYEEGRINSERTLQAELYALLARMVPPEAHVLCEPRIEGLKSHKAVAIPDILITRENQVVAALELKFGPEMRPDYEFDLKKLIAYGGGAEKDFSLLLDPATGRFSDQRFSFLPDCLLVFCVFGRHDSKAVDKEMLDKQMADDDLQDRFMALVHPVGPL